jgi:predicted MPP superfamily phosphohydrolase
MIINKRFIRLFSFLFPIIVLGLLVYVFTFSTTTQAKHPILQDILNLAKNSNQDPYVLISIGFKTCFSFAFFEYCYDDINNAYKLVTNLTSDHQVINSIQINYLGKNLYKKKGALKTAYPYEVRLPIDMIKEYKIPVINEFYIFSKLDGYTLKNIPNKILQDTDNTTDILQLNSMGYNNAGYGVWYKSTNSYNNLYSKINFIFSSQITYPFPGWKAVSSRPINLYKNDYLSEGIDRDLSDFKSIDYHKYDHEAYLYVQEQSHIIIPKADLKINKSGKFKIIQLADLHLSTGFGKCLDIYPEIDYPNKNCLADKLTLDFINQVLDLENPDMVVLTGDQIYGQDSFDSETTIFKVVKPLIERKIPYAMVFGNHDDEGDSLSREKLMDLIQSLPYSVSSAGPDDIDGVGNYEVIIGDNQDPQIILYMLDSHSRVPGKIGYDWFKESQKNYVELLSSSHSASPNALKLAFFHIPLFEYRNIYNKNVDEYQGALVEGVMSPNINTDMFKTLKNVGVKLISVGHDHCNDFCFNNDDVTLCYGGSVGFGGYGGYGGYQRRIRIFEIDTNLNNQITTWKRVFPNFEETIDTFIL